MKSKITLYYKSLVNKEKNFILDNQNGTSALETYLSTLTSESINEFQYVKQGLSVSIKLNKNQVALEMVDSKDLNYVKIQNFDVVNNQVVLEKPYYYFVIAKNWKAQDTIELVLSMDTLNTFRFNYDYRLNKKTLTKRMHKDRYWKFITALVTPPRITSSTSPAIPNSYLDTPIENVYIEFVNNSGDIPLYYILESKKIIIKTNELPLSKNGLYIYNLNEKDSKFFNDNRLSTDWKLNYFVIGSNIFELTEQFPLADFVQEYQYIRKIDLKSEDITAPVYKKSETTLYEQEGKFTNSWVLYYKNKDNQDNSPVDCFLTSDTELTFLTETGSNTITSSDIPNGKMLMFTPAMSGDFVMNIDGTPYRVYKQLHALGNTDAQWCIGIKNNNGTLTFYYYKYYNDYGDDYNVTKFGDEIEIVNPTTIQIDSSITELKCMEITPPPANTYLYSTPNNPFKIGDSNKTLTLAPLTERILAPSSTIDKTLSENLKIINVPYCPSQIAENIGKYTIESLWKYDGTSSFFKLDDFSYRFSNSVVTNADDILNTFKTGLSLNLNEKRNFDFYHDSKLYHSDYYRPKFVYDSFTKIFPLEQIDYYSSFSSHERNNPVLPLVFTFTFIMSRNIVSKFLFKFDYVYKLSNEDYNNIVAVARNNEEVLYNSAYLNYVRTGFNYDVKSKERQEVTGGVGIGLSVLGFVTSLLLTATGVGAGLGVMGMVGSTIGLASSAVNFAKTTAQNEENIQRKLQETQRQAVAVLNADDYDLLYEYSQNKAKLCLYEVSDNMKRVLDDLFYYCGYVVNEQFIPDISSRYWFNFVQAGLIIEDSSNLNSDIEDDIKEKFEQGVTFLHYHNKFDFVQEMENWETSLLD